MKAKAIVLAMVMASFFASCSAPETDLSQEDTTQTVDSLSTVADTSNAYDQLATDSVANEN